MKKTILSFLIILSALSSLYAEKNPFFIPPSALSASYSSGSFSSMINPVFTGGNEFPALAYSFIKQDEGGWNHFASLNLFGFDFTYSHYNMVYPDNDSNNPEVKASLYTINRGLIMGNIFGVGVGYSFSSSPDEALDDYRGWHAGFLLRPARFLSLAAVFKDINAHSYNDRIDRNTTYSVSIRPFNEYITMTADMTKYTGGLKTDYNFGFELNDPHGITLSCKGDTDKNFTFALNCPFSFRRSSPTMLKFDAYAGINSNRTDFAGGGISLTATRQKRSFQVSSISRPLYIRLSDNYSDENSRSGFMSGEKLSYHHLAEGIKQASGDMTINSIILDIDHVSLGFAQLQEVRKVLADFRKSGRKVHAILNYTGNREYYLASCADRIYFTPNSTFAITGLKMQSYYIKGLADKAGIKYESTSKGKYKSFNENFTRDSMSEAVKENMRQVLSDLNEQFIKGITEGRNIPTATINELFSAGFYTPEKALEKGFIDEVIYRDNALNQITGSSATLNIEDYIKEKPKPNRWGELPEIAVVHVNGSIVSGEGDYSLLSGATTGDYDYRSVLEQVFSSSDVKGVVIRIDSGGGSAAASDFMWNYLILMKKQHPKPVVFSFGNTAASGGYYIACTGDRIFTESGTITGSIGVVAGKVSLKELYAKLGINTETIKMSEFADTFTETRELTEKEKELVQQSVDFIYERFTGRVIEGRKIPAAKIPDIAEGKIHTGNSAKKEGLTDEIGGLITAVEYIKNLSGTGDEYIVNHYPERPAFFSRLIDTKIESSLINNIKTLVNIAGKFPEMKENILYMSPYYIVIE